MRINALRNLYEQHEGKVSDKWALYLSEYDALFQSYRDKELAILEIGIQNGGSLEIYAKYFPTATRIVGCDIDQACRTLTFEDPRIAVVVGDANSVEAEQEILSLAPEYDLIIDDGSHRSGDIVRSYSRYFRHLKPGGHYIVEDLHCSYWSEFEGGLFYPYSSMSFFKRLSDVLSHEHWGVDYSRRELLAAFSRQYQADFCEDDLAQVHSVQFVNSLCIIEKLPAQHNHLGPQTIAGVLEPVYQGRKLLNGQLNVAAPQAEHFAMYLGPVEEVAAEQRRQLSTLNETLIIHRQENEGLRTQLRCYQQEISELRGELAKNLEQLTALEASNESQRLAEEAARARLHERDLQLDQVLNSRIWRATRPLRATADVLKLAPHSYSTMQRGLRTGRSMVATFGARTLTKKLFAILRTEGLSGALRRGAMYYRRQQLAESVETTEGDLKVDIDYLAFSAWRQRQHNRPSICNFSNARNDINARLYTNLGSYPTISILTPVYNADPVHLQAAVNSVLSQSYQNWELILVDDHSTRTGTQAVLRDIKGLDERIIVITRTDNGNISKASNDGLQRATGEFVALLDHDDLLAPNALLEVARAIKLWPEVDFLYTDEDKLSETGQHHSAYYKPDWSPSLLLSTMYTSHLSVYRRTLVHKVGGFRSAFDGTQDYDLALRITEQTSNICHIPLILYHWRESANSTAQSLGNKKDVIGVQQRALADALGRRGTPGEVVPHPYAGNWNVHYRNDSLPLISIVIPSATRQASIRGKQVNLATNCVDNILTRTDYPNVEIVVVHNNDIPQDVASALEAIEQVTLVEYHEAELNLARKINIGVDHASGDYLVILNDDIEIISPKWLDRMLGNFAEAGVGVVGAKLFFENGSIQHAGVVWMDTGPSHAYITMPADEPGAHLTAILRRDVLAVTGACMMVPRALHAKLGGYDETFPLNYNDIDYCLRARDMGYRIIVDNDVHLHHFESISKTGTYARELNQLYSRWQRVDDPFYNINYDRSLPFFNHRHATAGAPESYESWLERHVLKSVPRRPADHDGTASRTLRFSLLTAVHNTPSRFLHELSDTVFNQTYQNFEWILVENASQNADTLEAVQAIAARSSKVRVFRQAENLGIIGGLRAAAEHAVGDYMCPLDHDDLLTCNALDQFSAALDRDPTALILYTDEDKCDEQGNRFAPFLKPDFDHVYFSSCCYIAHFCCIQRAKAMELQCYSDVSANGCHDFDTFYRFLHAGVSPVHVPSVTYSWRMHGASTATGDPSVKPYTQTSQRAVLERHLAFVGKDKDYGVQFNRHHGSWKLNRKSPWENSVATVQRQGQGWIVHSYNPKGLEYAQGMAMEFSFLKEALLHGATHHPTLLFKAPDLECSPGWIESAAVLLDFFEDAAMVGGRICSGNTIACAGLYAGYRNAQASPYAGLHRNDIGYYGLLANPHRVDALSPLLWGCKSNYLLDFLQPLPDEVEIPDLLGALYEEVHERRKYVMYSPDIVATMSANAEAAGSGRPFTPNADFLQTHPHFYNRQLSATEAFALG